MSLYYTQSDYVLPDYTRTIDENADNILQSSDIIEKPPIFLVDFNNLLFESIVSLKENRKFPITTGQKTLYESGRTYFKPESK